MTIIITCQYAAMNKNYYYCLFNLWSFPVINDCPGIEEHRHSADSKELLPDIGCSQKTETEIITFAGILINKLTSIINPRLKYAAH